MIQTNTHHAYLNNIITLSSDSCDTISITDISTNKVYEFTESIDLRLSAGEHIFDDGVNQFKIVIEDAIKIGGSKFKTEACYVSEETPWIFVTMKDRLYIYNRGEKKGRVEYSVTPDEIIFTKNRERDIFILRTKHDYTIFDVSKNEVLYMFCNLEYFNDHIVIYKEDDKVIIYDFVQGVKLYSFEKDYSIFLDNQQNKNILFFVSDTQVKLFDLNNNEETLLDGILIDEESCKINFDGCYGTSCGYCIFSKWLITSWCVVDMFNRTAERICKSELSKVIKILTKEIWSKEQFEDRLNRFKERIDFLNDYPYIHHTAKFAEYYDIVEEAGDPYIKYRTKEYVIGKYINQSAFEYHIQNLSTGKDELLSLHDYYAFGKHEESIEKMLSVEYDNGKVLSCSETTNLLLVERGEKLYIVDLCHREEVQILADLFDSTFCTNAFFTSDGKHLILEKNVGVRDFFELNTYESSTFPIEGSTTNRFLSSNGYKPLADHTMPYGSAPVWIDPLTMRRVNPSVLNTRSYISPDGRIIAHQSYKSIYHNNLDGNNISLEELQELKSKYNWYGNIAEGKKEGIIRLREKLVARYQKVFNKQTAKYLQYMQFIKKDGDKVQETLKRLVNSHAEFTELFVDRMDYVVYNEADIEKKVLIGRTVWYLNYISYSKDSRYMAFGAKMNSDFFRGSEAGVFVIYDLQEEKEISRMGAEDNLWAVWTTQFSSRNDVACYDSQPTTYLKLNDPSKDLLVIDGRSFLCFSPSGNYMALSEQGYIDYTHHPDAEWGHQPSTNIYICPVASSASYNFIGPYSDLGDDICGISKYSRRAHNIASAAFSVDEKRLLMVGEDGVVVVRNLHLEDIVDTESFSSHRDKDGDVWTTRKLKCNW